MSSKPYCPKCHVPVTDQGTCPYCETEVKSRWRPAKPKREYEIVKGIPVRCGLISTTRWVRGGSLQKVEDLDGGEDTTWVSTERILKVDNSFFEQFEYRNYNAGDDFEEFKSFPRVKTEIVENQKALKGKKKVQLFNVKGPQRCEECGCEVTVRDLNRGEVVCPRCGLVQGRVETKGGEVVMW